MATYYEPEYTNVWVNGKRISDEVKNTWSHKKVTVTKWYEKGVDFEPLDVNKKTGYKVEVYQNDLCLLTNMFRLVEVTRISAVDAKELVKYTFKR